MQHSKLIAEVSAPDKLPASGERGFPHWGTWMEASSWFHFDVCDLLDDPDKPAQVGKIATRLTGSADLSDARWEEGYPGNLAVGRRPAFVVNDAKTEVKPPKKEEKVVEEVKEGPDGEPMPVYSVKPFEDTKAQEEEEKVRRRGDVSIM